MKIEKAETLFQLTEILSLIKTLESFYPDVEHWYINKVIPRVMLGEDIVLVLKDDSEKLAGVAIGKKTETESKLCCLKVIEDFQSRGYGIKLIKNMLRELGNDYPHCSVSEDLFHIYSQLFVNHFGWSVDDVKEDVYKKGKLEYYFNGKMKVKDML